MHMKIDWKDIIERWQEPLYWHIRRMVVSHDDAKDLLQEVFVQAFQSIGQLRDPKAMKAWLYRIATNKCLRFLEKAQEGLSLDEVPAAMMDRLTEGEYINLKDIAGVRFQKALMTLSPQQKAVFTMRYYDDLSYTEISAITGSSPAVLKVSYAQAKKKMKAYLLAHE